VVTADMFPQYQLLASNASTLTKESASNIAGAMLQKISQRLLKHQSNFDLDRSLFGLADEYTPAPSPDAANDVLQAETPSPIPVRQYSSAAASIASNRSVAVSRLGSLRATMSPAEFEACTSNPTTLVKGELFK
jgi:hypothetical protein